LCLALAFPSPFEVSGTPVVEAMRAGGRVVSSPAATPPEVGGAAALSVAPRRPEELADRILEIAPERRADLVEAGQKQARRFSWDRTARDVLEVFRGLRAQAAASTVAAPSPEPPAITVVTQ